MRGITKHTRLLFLPIIYEMPCRLSGEIGPLSCRGPLCLRGQIGARPETNRPSLPLFSILNDSNKCIACNRLWVALFRAENQKACILPVSVPPNAFGGLVCLCLQNDARFFISSSHLVTLPSWQGDQSIPLLWLSLGSDTRKPPKALCMYGLVFSQFKISAALQPSP